MPNPLIIGDEVFFSVLTTATTAQVIALLEDYEDNGVLDTTSGLLTGNVTNNGAAGVFQIGIDPAAGNNDQLNTGESLLIDNNTLTNRIQVTTATNGGPSFTGTDVLTIVVYLVEADGDIVAQTISGYVPNTTQNVNVTIDGVQQTLTISHSDATDVISITSSASAITAVQLTLTNGALKIEGIDLTPNNAVPDAVNDLATTAEDTAVTITVLSNDTDADGNTLTVTNVSDPTNGTATINPDGTVNYTPDANFNGTETFTYTISDGNGGTDTATVTVTVNAVNDVPDAVNDSATTNEDTGVTITVLGNDTDADGNTLTVTGVSDPANGTVTINGDGTVDYTPDADFNGTDTFTYTISDGNGGTDTATVTVTVNAVNDAPDAVNDSFTTQEDIAQLTGNVLLDNGSGADSDVDGDTLTVTGNTNPSNGTVTVNSDGTFTYTPDADFNGTDTFTYTISDGNGGTDTATVTVTVNAVNDIPDAVDNSYSSLDGQDVTGNLITDDTGEGVDSDLEDDTLTVTGNTSPANGSVTVNSDGTFTYNPNDGFVGTDSFTYTISDGNGGSDTATVNITVGNIPNLVNDSFTIEEDTINFSSDVTTNDTSLGDPTPTITLVTDVSNGSLTFNSDGTFTYTPNANYFGIDTFVYQVEDGTGDIDTATVQIAVDANPDIADDNYDVLQNGTLTDDVTTNDTDSGDVPAIISLVNDVSNGSLTFNSDGTFTYTPNTDFVGTDSFTYDVTDENGDSATATVTITVNSLNEPPVPNDDPLISDLSGTVTEITDNNPGENVDDVTATGDIPFTDPNIDNTHSITNITPQGSGYLGNFSAVISNSVGEDEGDDQGVITWDFSVPDSELDPLAEGETLTQTYEIEVADDNGGTATTTVTITITGTNDAPIATFNAPQSATEDGAVINGQLTSDDVDNGATVTYALEGFPIPGLTINPDGSWSFDPTVPEYQGLAEGETQVIPVTYVVTDEFDASGVGTFNITVTGVNDAPVIDDQTSTVTGGVTEIADGAAGENTDILGTGGVINFTDLDLSDTHTASFSVPGGTAYVGTFTVDTAPSTDDGEGSIAWNFEVPDAVVDSLAQGETLTQTYTVTVTDENGGTDSTNVTVTVTGTNDAPVIDDETSIVTGGVTEIADGDVGENTDILGTGGTIDFVDVDLSDTHTVSFSVPGGTAYVGTFTVDLTTSNEEEDVAIAWDFEVPDAVVDSLAQGETLIQTYTVTVTDNNGATDSTNVTVTVTGTNDAPVINEETSIVTGGVTEIADGAVGENTDILGTGGTIDFVDVDLTDTHTASFSVPGGTAYVGTFSLTDTTPSTDDGEGSIAWNFAVPDAVVDSLAQGETLTQTYTVTVTDENGATDSTNVTVTVTGTNDAPVINDQTSDVTGGVTEIADGAVGENTDILGTGGTIDFVDVDLIDTHTASFSVPGGTAYVGTFTVDTTPSTDDGAGTIEWNFEVPDAVIDSLAQGETLIQTYTVTVTDNNGATDSTNVTVTVTGTNDRPVLTVDTSGSVTEDASSPNLTDTGTISAQDVDIRDIVTITSSYNNNIAWNGVPVSSLSTVEQELGLSIINPIINGFTLNIANIPSGSTTSNGNWNYSVSNSLVQFLGAGERITLSYNINATDNSGATNNTDTETVTITINGVNDAPIALDDNFVMELNEANGDGRDVSISGNLFIDNGNGSDFDVDFNDTIELAPTSTGTFNLSNGTLVVQSNGNFTFTPIVPNATPEVDDGFTFTFNYTIRDRNGSGALNGTTDVGTLTIEVIDPDIQTNTVTGTLESGQEVVIDLSTEVVTANSDNNGLEDNDTTFVRGLILPKIDLLYVIDVSESSLEQFDNLGTFGDLNGDGFSNTRLDAQIGALLEVTEFLYDQSEVLSRTELNIRIMTYSDEVESVVDFFIDDIEMLSEEGDVQQYLTNQTEAEDIFAEEIDPWINLLSAYGLRYDTDGATSPDAALDGAVDYFTDEDNSDSAKGMLFFGAGTPNVSGDGDGEEPAGEFLWRKGYNSRALQFDSELSDLADEDVEIIAVNFGDSGYLNEIDSDGPAETYDSLLNRLNSEPLVGAKLTEFQVLLTPFDVQADGDGNLRRTDTNAIINPDDWDNYAIISEPFVDGVIDFKDVTATPLGYSFDDIIIGGLGTEGTVNDNSQTYVTAVATFNDGSVIDVTNQITVLDDNLVINA